MPRDMTPDDEEVARGYTRPFRTYVKHAACEKLHRLGRAQAAALATDPTTQSRLTCPACRDHFPVADFVWVDFRDDGNRNFPGEETAYPVGS